MRRSARTSGMSSPLRPPHSGRMSDATSTLAGHQPPSARLAALLGLPDPGPWTGADRRDYEEWTAEGDRRAQAAAARRQQQAA